MARKTEQDDAARTDPSGRKTRQAESTARVGSHLRSIYAEVLAERTPDSLEDLLKKLA